MQKPFLSLLACLLCAALAIPCIAAEVDSNSIYCFEEADFSTNESLAGICITSLPDPATGTVMLGTRVVQEGDVFTAEQLSRLTFRPLRTEADAVATVGYLPIYADRVERNTTLTLSVWGKENQAPTAKDQTLETYRNIPNEGSLKVSDPEVEALTYTLVRKPRRGDVAIREDGTFTYTPKKNKVGVDSFTFTATDPAGKVSREATVTVQILKPSQSDHYQDTLGLPCRFEAEWLRSTGLFAAEQLGGAMCFQPEKEVTRGEFLVMLLELLETPLDEPANAALVQSAPVWLRPYLSTALRTGLISEAEAYFHIDAPITAEEARRWLSAMAKDAPIPTDGALTRAHTACLLYSLTQ